MDVAIPDLDHSFLPVLDDALRSHADRVCAVFEGRTATYADVDVASARVANALLRDGFEPGDHGAVYSSNSIDAFVTAIGIVRAGGVWVPLNPRNSPTTNLEILVRFGCDALIYRSDHADTATEIADRLGGIQAEIANGAADSLGPGALLEEWLAGTDEVAPSIERQGSDTLCLPQTGGTTGVPKGVMLSHRNFAAFAWAIRERWDGQQRVTLCAAPMTHVAGRAAVVSLGIGVELVVLGTVDPAGVLAAIEEHRVTDVFLPPTAIYALLDHPDTRSTDFRSLRNFSYGSAPMSIPRLREAFDVFGPVMTGGFGQTESPMFIARAEPEDHFVDSDVTGELLDDDTLRSVGRETILSTVAIVDEDAEPVSAGTRGEIAVKGPMVSEGYYENPDETAKIRRNGWHLTGDIGVMDDDDRIFIVDRKKDMIISGGFNIYSTEVEQALHAIDGIAEAAVIGIPSDQWGEEVKAVVRLSRGADLTEADIINRCKRTLGSVMAPKSVDLVLQLPRTAVGKIDKKALRDPHWADTGRRI